MKILSLFQSKTQTLCYAFLLIGLTQGCEDSRTVFDENSAALLETSLNNSVAELGIPGAVLAVRSPDGAVWKGTSGYARLNPDLPMSPEMHFHIGSITKSFTATIILQTDPSWGWAAGSINSTISDLLLWTMVLADGGLISSRMHQERMKMHPINITGLDNISYGLGIYSDNGAIGHGGDYSGFYTAYAVRYKGYDFAVLVNGQMLRQKLDVHVPARNVFWNAAQALELHSNRP